MTMTTNSFVLFPNGNGHCNWFLTGWNLLKSPIIWLNTVTRIERILSIENWAPKKQNKFVKKIMIAYCLVNDKRIFSSILSIIDDGWDHQIMIESQKFNIGFFFLLYNIHHLHLVHNHKAHHHMMFNAAASFWIANCCYSIYCHLQWKEKC